MESLKKNEDFSKCYRTGRSYVNRDLVLYVCGNDLNRNRVGISVSKKVGNSVVRHRITRLIRESYRLQLESMIKNLMIWMIKFYRKYLSPLKSTKCPYIPTCSEYGLEAVEKYGALKGGLLALWRILRCNPFSHGGYDPVP